METINHKRGDTFDRDLTYTTDGCVAIDITGYAIRCQARDSDDVELFDIAIGTGITITSATSGQYSMSIAAATTASWTAGNYSVDIEYTDSSSIVISTETFTLTVLEDITQ